MPTGGDNSVGSITSKSCAIFFYISLVVDCFDQNKFFGLFVVVVGTL